MKIMFYVRSVSLGVMCKLYEKQVFSRVTYGVGTWDSMLDERHRLDVMDFKCFLSVCGVTRMDCWRNEEVRLRVGVKKKDER